jgi:deoxyribose-phosphate aldolase
MKINKYVDHTLLSPDLKLDSLKRLIKEAEEYKFKTICIPPSFIKYAKKENKNISICTVIGFPFGYQSTKSKIDEAKNAIKDGADEIDMVINIALFKNNKENEVIKEINKIKKAINDHTLKVIIETSYWNSSEIERLTKLIVKSNADYIKTSTGFTESGAKLDDIKIMKKTIDSHNSSLKIKASGGIKSLEFAKELINNGVNRLGTSSGVQLINNIKVNKNY